MTNTYTEKGIKLDVIFDENVFINATEIYKSFGKNQTAFNNFISRKLKPYAQRLIDLGKISEPQNVIPTDLVVVRNGGDTSKQGTWLHPKLAIVFARWLSMDFEIWCDSKIEELLTTGTATATIDERVAWLDKFDFFYKSLRKKKNWGKGFKETITTIEDEGISLKTQKEFIVKASSCVKTVDREGMYVRMLGYYKELLELGAIERRTWEDMTGYINTNLRALHKLRHTYTKKELDELRASYALATDELAKLKIEAAATPVTPVTSGLVLTGPTDITKMDFTNVSSINDSMAMLKANDEIEIMESHYMEVNPVGGTKSTKGKTLPTYISPRSLIQSTDVAVWSHNENPYVQWASGVARKRGFNLCKTDHDDSLFTASQSAMPGIVGISYYCYFCPGSTNYLVIFRHTQKHI